MFESFRIAVEGLIVNRLRALLTMLGIIIGVGSVIGLISLGRGVEDFLASEFEGFGSNLLVVYSEEPTSPTRDRIEPITTLEVLDLLDPAIAPSIGDAAPITGVFANVIYRGESRQQIVYGVGPTYIEIRDYVPEAGGFVTQRHVDDKARVAVLGFSVSEDLFGENVDPVGETIRMNEILFTVIGKMEETSAIAGENNYIYVPISTAQQRLQNARTRDGGYRVDAVYFQAVDENAMDSASREIELYLTEAHNVQFEGEQDFTIVNQSDILDSLGAITRVLTVFLSLIAGVSLVVGGIGVMNIMLVSVTERTKEIGLRKAVGARGRDILGQFLIESIILSLLGGAFGILLGVTLSAAGDFFVEQLNLSVQLDSVLLAVLVSSFVGIVFGVYPAYRAARMRPIDALRFD